MKRTQCRSKKWVYVDRIVGRDFHHCRPDVTDFARRAKREGGAADTMPEQTATNGVAATASAPMMGWRLSAGGKFIPLPPSVSPNAGNTRCGNAGGVAGVNWVVTCLSELDRQDVATQPALTR